MIIQEWLSMYWAHKLIFNYSGNGEVTAPSLVIEFDGRAIGFRLPASIDQVQIVLNGVKRKNRRGHTQRIKRMLRVGLTSATGCRRKNSTHRHEATA
jgi:hypothetical protein